MPVGVFNQVFVHNFFVANLEYRECFHGERAFGSHHLTDAAKRPGPSKVLGIETGEVQAHRRVSRITRDVHAARARKNGRHCRKPVPRLQRLVYQPRLACYFRGPCAGEIVVLKYNSILCTDGAKSPRPRASMNQRISKRHDPFVLADSSDA